jgi:hypothetical protein
MISNETPSRKRGKIGKVMLRVVLVAITAIFAIILINVTGITSISYQMLLHSSEGLNGYYGVQYSFALLLVMGLTSLTVANVRRDKWYIIGASIVAYLMYGIACIVYGFMFDTKEWLNQLRHASPYDFFIIYIVIAPLVSGAWIAGALASCLYVVLERWLTTKAKAALR